MKTYTMAISLSTFMVLSAYGQYFSRTYFTDLPLGSFTYQVLPIPNNEILQTHKFPCESTTFCGGVSKINEKLNNIVIHNTGNKDFFYHTCKVKDDTIYLGSWDLQLQNGKYNWYFNKMTLEGENLVLSNFELNIKNNAFAYLYGIELVKNDEIILWGSGNDPALDNEKNDPRVIWLRLRSDGTLVSGPHYFKPASLEDPAQATDSGVDTDGNMVFVYEYTAWGVPEKYIFKILENDSIQEICRFPLNERESNPRAKIKVTHDGHYIVTNYDTSKKNTPPLLTKLDRQGQKVWESSFDLIYGYWSGFNLPTVGKFTVNRLSEAKDGDILMCGFNAQVDTFYVPFLRKKVAVTGWTGAYMARFSPDGRVKWVHFLASVKDNGTFRKININDIQEMDDGSIVVGGSLGVRDTLSTKYHSWVMKVGPNGCFDPECSHVDKWWYFPEEIASATEELISHGKLTIYPNPGHDVINVILPDDAFLPVRYRITDMQGRTHESGVQNQRDIKLDAGFLPSGIYHVVIMDKSDKRWTGKWVKD